MSNGSERNEQQYKTEPHREEKQEKPRQPAEKTIEPRKKSSDRISFETNVSNDSNRPTTLDTSKKSSSKPDKVKSPRFASKILIFLNSHESHILYFNIFPSYIELTVSQKLLVPSLYPIFECKVIKRITNYSICFRRRQ